MTSKNKIHVDPVPAARDQQKDFHLAQEAIQSFEESPDPNFGRAAQQPSGVSGKGSRVRINSFDLARGFTVLLMPSIHVVMLYSQPTVQQSLLGDILGFIAEGPGAQLFMLLMGVSFTLSSKINTRSVLKRTFYLLLAAYLLNYCKFIIPLAFGWLPQNLLAELNLENNYTAIPFFLFLGDILHFAAIACPLLFIVYRLKHYQYWSAIFAVAIIFLSPLIWDIKSELSFVDYGLQLLGGHPPDVFFPVFPWLVYPLIGLTIGYYLKRYDHATVIKKLAATGITLIIISCILPATKTKLDYLPFYRPAPADTIFHLGFVLTWLGIIHWLSKKIRPNYFFALLTFCSKNITAIYIIQWIAICWSLSITGYMQLDFVYTTIWMICITLFTLSLTYLLKLK